MLSFTILRPYECGCGRFYIYNHNGTEIAQCASMDAVFNYFYTWCKKMGSKSVTYTRTQDEHVLLVKMD